MKKTTILSATFALIMGAQAHAQTTTASDAKAGSTVSPSSAVGQLSDDQIAEIMKKANDAEIDAAKTARSRATSADVKGFAKHMIDEHTTNNKMAKKVESGAKISLSASDNSKAMEREAAAKQKDLKAASKAEFDRAYIEQQVAMHSQLLKDLDSTYIPQTQNAELKAFLEQTRGNVQQHLQMAQQILAKLPSGGTKGTSRE